MDTSSIFYKMANFSGEVERMEKAYFENRIELAEKFKSNAMSIAEAAIRSPLVKSAGKEEWYTVNNLLDGYTNIDSEYTKHVLLKFGEPFAISFAYKM